MFEEIVANLTKPLGITIEASTDEASLVYITSVGAQVRHSHHAVLRCLALLAPQISSVSSTATDPVHRGCCRPSSVIC